MAVRELMRELEMYKELAAAGESARVELEHLKSVKADFEKSKSQLAFARDRVKELESLVDLGEERVNAANTEKNEALKLRDKVQKELDLKTFALRRSQKVAALERRTTMGMKKKTEKLQDDLDREKREHGLTQNLRQAMESELHEQKQDVARERELRLLGMHRHQLLIHEDAAKLKQLQNLPHVLQQTQSNLRMAKEDNTVLATALGVEQGVNETMEEFMDQTNQQNIDLRNRLHNVKVQRDEARDAHAALVKSYKDLQAYTDMLQHHLISKMSPIVGKSCSGVQATLLKKRPKPPFPLGRDWGHGESNVKHHQLPTYTTMLRMRGKSPDEVVAIMTDNVQDAETHLEQEHKRQKELAFQVEKLKLRCERLQARKEAIDQVAILIKRRQNEELEKDPYTVPINLRPTNGMTTIEQAEDAAKKLQAVFRAKKSRQTLMDANLEKQVNLEAKIPGLRTSIANLERVMGELDEEMTDLEGQVKNQRKEMAQKSAELLQCERNDIPGKELALKRRRAALQRALEEQQRNEVDMMNRAPDMLHSTVIRAATAPPDTGSHTLGGSQSLSYAALAHKVAPEDREKMEQNLQMEREWRGGGSSAPRGANVRTNASVAYISPMLPPPRWRRKMRQDAALQRLDEAKVAHHGPQTKMTNNLLENDLASTGSHPLLLDAKHSPATIQHVRNNNTKQGDLAKADQTIQQISTGTSGPRRSWRRGVTKAGSGFAKRTRSHPAPTELAGSLHVGKGLRMRKVTEKDVDDEVQSRLEISTRGSTRQILQRVRMQLDKNSNSSSRMKDILVEKNRLTSTSTELVLRE